jgi:hypothetical protein
LTRGCKRIASIKNFFTSKKRITGLRRAHRMREKSSQLFNKEIIFRIYREF